ncbi:malonyl-ACP O-methyltransferase BioC [Microbulbifer celer]|uniref:Malonyl-[acyl-carrier protein] O-methyltransferase n=1 Tax=Microbulbifer celer TaxID=435905 RepID=A0ABW3U809_9GAMM|nr:malonyl-ACP O-methyltransferase BioC [Microbulbifer celer]UFN57274.1 malonyl-ACP O-methyltransferase BioC [Microbulbifer celer]
MNRAVKNIVLIHGWGGDSRCWDALLPALGDMPQKVHCVELPGFGSRTGEAWPATGALLEQLEATLPDNCLLVGWSLGGMLAVQLAARSNKVRGLVTIAANGSFVARDGSPGNDEAGSEWPGMAAEDFAQFCRAQRLTPEKNWQRFCGLEARGDRNMRSVLKTLKGWQPETVSECWPDSWNDALECLGELDNRALLAHLKQPSLHILGARDALVPSAAADQLRAQGCMVEVIADSGHCPHLSRADTIARLLKQHLQTLSAADGESAPLDKSAVARAFGRAAASYDAAAHLQRAVCRQLLSSAEAGWQPRRILDLGSGTGYGSELLRQRFPEAEIIALDIAPQMLAYARNHRPRADGYVAADAENLPLADGSFDLVYSSFALQWCYRLPHLFAEIRRILSVDGRALISTLAPGTLAELEASWTAVDSDRHVNQFLPAASWQQACADNHLDCALTSEQRVLHFDNVKTLMRELKSIGAHNVNREAGKGLLSRERLRRLTEAYEARRTPAGLPATYEVVYLTLQRLQGDNKRPVTFDYSDSLRAEQQRNIGQAPGTGAGATVYPHPLAR